MEVNWRGKDLKFHLIDENDDCIGTIKTKKDVDQIIKKVNMYDELVRVVWMDRDKHLMGKKDFRKKYGIDWEEINIYRNKILKQAEL